MAGSSFTRHLTEAPRRCRELKTAPVKKDRQIYVPPGWPPKVRNPGESFWEESATEYLLDCCPPDYRQHSVLRKYPLALAYLTGEHVQAQLAANFQAKSKIRHSLSKRLDPVAVEAVIEVLHREEIRLQDVRYGVVLITRALLGVGFSERL